MIEEETLKLINKVKNDIKLRENEESLRIVQDNIMVLFKEYQNKQEELLNIEEQLKDFSREDGFLKSQIEICKSRKLVK